MLASMNDDNRERFIQTKHLIATGKTCDLPPPQEVVDLYLWTDSRRAAVAAEEANAKAKWKELSAEGQQVVAGFMPPALLRKMGR